MSTRDERARAGGSTPLLPTHAVHEAREDTGALCASPSLRTAACEGPGLESIVDGLAEGAYGQVRRGSVSKGTSHELARGVSSVASDYAQNLGRDNDSRDECVD